MERYHVIGGHLRLDPEGTVTSYADAQRALDAEREKVKRLSTCGTDHSTPWWQVKCEDLEAQLATLQAQLAQPIHICQRCGRVSRDGWVTARYECDELHGSLQCPDCQCIDLETNTAKELAALCSRAQAQLADRDAMILQMGEQAAALAKENMAVKAQLRQVEGDAETYRKMHAVCTMNLALANNDLATLRQLVEALPVVDGRMDVECGACYYIRSFVAEQYGVVCGLITEQATAMAIKALLEYRATLDITSTTKGERMEHEELVRRIAKSGQEIKDSLSAKDLDLWHHATGCATEAGELLDAAKKVAIYNKPVDRENVIEELGDLEFYMQGLRANLGITREECLAHNIAKLTKRYPKGTFDNADAVARADKHSEQDH